MVTQEPGYKPKVGDKVFGMVKPLGHDTGGYEMNGEITEIDTETDGKTVYYVKKWCGIVKRCSSVRPFTSYNTV